MTVQELCTALGCRVLCGTAALQTPVTGGYCGDLLSRVMGRAPRGCAWVTVMGNPNAVAVAVLCEAACILLAEGAQPDAQALAKAEENGVAVLADDRPAYEIAVALFRALGQ